MNKLFYIFGVFFIVYYFALVFSMGPVSFSFVMLIVGVALVVIGLSNYFLGNNVIYIRIVKILKPMFFIGLAIFIVTELGIVIFSFQRNMEKSDYTIVLGAGVRGTVMTNTLYQRVEKVNDYCKKYNDFGYIVVSGGQGPLEYITEAEAMKRYFVENGISEDLILKEEKSTDTYENLMFSKEIIENHSGKDISDLNIKIVTSGFHLLRAKVLSQALGYKKVTFCGAGIWAIFIPNYYVREFIGFYKMLVFDVLLK